MSTALPIFRTCSLATSGWWLPANYAQDGGLIDGLFGLIAVVCLAVLVIVQVALVWFLFRYRHRAGRRETAAFVHGHTTWEIGWTVVAAMILTLLAARSIAVWEDYNRSPDPARDGTPEPLRVMVIGQQFKWNVIYAGADNQLGRYLVYPKPTDTTWPGGERFRGTNGPAQAPMDNRQAMINAYIEQVNPLGKDMTDPAGQDDDWQNALARELVVPVNRPVEVHLSSRDVIHSLSIPAMRVKMDTVPGLIGVVTFTPTATSAEAAPAGYFDIVCQELCGASHYTMTGRLIVTAATVDAGPTR
jgi:cytochrome c oxidase subunit 2